MIQPWQRFVLSKYLFWLFVLPTGGHTGEILRVMEALRPAYSPRLYLVAQTDKMSETKIHAVEENTNDNHVRKI